MGEEAGEGAEDLEYDSGWPVAVGQPFDVEGYLERKSLLTIEMIKDVIGEIMSACKGRKYPILEYIMRMVLFERNPLRSSFMQEALYAAENGTYRNALQSYMNENNLKTATSVFRFEVPGA